MSNRRVQLKVMLAAPRGFCAGVVRAIEIVERALEKYGAPVYVRHEIVHNKYVVDDLKRKGAVFVEALDEIDDPERPVIFSAHGVSKSVTEEAQKRGLFHIDATCPLVRKVHFEAERHHELGREIILIGHRGHPEVAGTMGQLPEGLVHLIETVADAEAFIPKDEKQLAYTTQTTLSVDDTEDILAVLNRRFPHLAAPPKEDICYATTNRQDAVKALFPQCEALIVVGAPNSSNSLRLVETAKRAGCRRAFLVQRGTDVDLEALGEVSIIGITAGASAPDILVEEVIDALRTRYDVTVETVATRRENVTFKLPREVRDSDGAGAPRMA